MFKSILPTTKRNASELKDSSTPFHAIANAEGKENNRPGTLPQISQRSPTRPSFPTTPHSYDGRRGQYPPIVRFPEKNLAEITAVDQEFEKMLDDLQIPTTLRPKLATLESPVKAAMLRSSQVLTTTDPVSTPGNPRPKLRRSLSSTTLDSPRNNSLEYNFPCPPQGVSGSLDGPLAAPMAPFMTEGSGRPLSSLGHARGASLDTPRSTSHSHTPGNAKVSTGKPSKGGGRDLSPAALCTMLSNTSSTHLDVEVVKKLRLMLRNETASWSETFLQQGGYSALLTRLTEILEIEWREEQHDDQILHELLRCFKALSTSSIGCFALRSSSPTPFVQLVSLLYSDKKPGDLCTRQLIVDLLQVTFEIYPSRSSPGQTLHERREAWERHVLSGATTPCPTDTLPLPHTTLYSLVRALLLTPAPPPSESPSTPISPHAFIASLHLPRIFKSYLQELSDVCRDYFWVFCHPQNSIWNLEQTDQAKVERPRAPGGMTGGVEFEAMGYLTSHFHLINSLANAAQNLNLPADNEHSAYRLHSDLFASGIERVILTTRKASTTYYATLHLEIARYIALAGRARFELPWTLSRLIGSPPASMLRGAKSRGGSPRTSPTKSRGAHGGAPSIPTPTKVEPIKF